MKRRNVDNAKLRRTLKKNKISEGLCGNSLIYLKLLLVWASVIVADFVLGVRFEYLWTFWLLLRSIYDSFRYQGVAFSVFFVCITVTSDMICFVFVPVQWLFFLASTYVWVQYVWNACERGICVPTVSLWLLFIYVEASIRLKELKFVPFTMDLCRPFAAHCIGYPMVTLGFGVKSFVGHRLRMRKQREVARINRFHEKLLSEALPIEQVEAELDKSKSVTGSEEGISNGAMCSMNQQRLNNVGQQQLSTAMDYSFTNTSRSASAKNYANSSAQCIPKKSSTSQLNTSGGGSNSTTTSQNGSSVYDHHSSCNNTTMDDNGNHMLVDADDMEDADDSIGGSTSSSILNIIKAKLFGYAAADSPTSTMPSPKSASCFLNSSATSSSSPPPPSLSSPSWRASSMMHDSDEESKDSRDSQNVVSGIAGVVTKRHVGGKQPQKTKRRWIANGGHQASVNQQQSETPSSENVYSNDPNSPQPYLDSKEKVQDKDLYVSLESDIDKLKAELRTSRSREQDLRNQVQQFASADKSVKNELQQLRQNNEQLQTRIQNLVRSRQQDKQNMTTVEKKLADEQKLRAQSEQQLQQERKQKKAEEAARASSVAAAVAKSDCAESCKQRRRESETQVQKLRRDVQQREDQLSMLENELRGLRAFKEHNNVDVLMSALSAMREKNAHLETALSAETRIKLDLFSALGEAKRQLEIVQGKLVKKEHEMDEIHRHLHEESMYGMMSPMVTNANMSSPLTPPPSVGGGNHMDGSSMDLLGSAAYQTAAYMSSLPGVMFNEMVPNEYGALPLVTAGRVVPTSSNVAMHFPSTSHN